MWKRFRDTNYIVSSDGEICRIMKDGSRGRLLKRGIRGKGYRRVVFYNKSGNSDLMLHRIVAEVFIGPCPPGKEVNHKDGNKKNCKVDNLEYVTPLENRRHAIRTGLWDCRGEKSGKAKLTVKKVKEIRMKVIIKNKRVSNASSLGKEYGVGRCVIRLVAKNKIWI